MLRCGSTIRGAPSSSQALRCHVMVHAGLRAASASRDESELRGNSVRPPKPRPDGISKRPGGDPTHRAAGRQCMPGQGR